MHNEIRTNRSLIMIERLLVIMGIACLSWSTFVVARAWRYQTQSMKRTVAIEAPAAPLGDAEPAHPMPPSNLPWGEPIGTITVPRLRLSAAVAHGDDEGTLSVAIGHLPDTPLPWEEGNSALAGHRDTFFRALRDIRIGDEMRLATAYGDFMYRVNRMVIVTPDDLSVLAPTPETTLTLVTCYPFSFVGHAPKRFIVQATRVDELVATVKRAGRPVSHAGESAMNVALPVAAAP